MKRAVVFTSLAFILACGPAQPPKQAASSDPPDPTEETPSGGSKGGVFAKDNKVVVPADAVQ